jgi:Circadian oscillating protein COP23
MKIQSFVPLFTALTLAFGIVTLFEQPSYGQKKMFYCEKSNGIPTTFVRIEDGSRLDIIHWVSDYGLSQQWTPEKRCQEVSRRFQVSSDRGTLKFIKPGIVKGIPVICAPFRKEAPCTNENLLFTLKPGSNPESTFRRLIDRRALASGNALDESSGTKYIYVDIDKYFSNAKSGLNR